MKVSGRICFQDQPGTVSPVDNILETTLPVLIKSRYFTTPVVPAGSISHHRIKLKTLIELELGRMLLMLKPR